MHIRRITHERLVLHATVAVHILYGICSMRIKHKLLKVKKTFFFIENSYIKLTRYLDTQYWKYQQFLDTMKIPLGVNIEVIRIRNVGL